MRDHQAIDRRSLEMARRIVAKIDVDPSRTGLDQARAVCRRWVERGNRSALEWIAILERPWPEIRAILLEDSEEGRRLRQTDPFCGILTPQERWEIYREAARHEASEVEHVLRAAGAITGIGTWVLVGSQAILGAYPDAPGDLLTSDEIDLFAPDDERASDLVDGSIGEKSPFHETFGYYGHGVGPRTAVLPKRWQERAIRIASPATGGVTGICPHPTDLAISKIVAWRDKDQVFVRALVQHGLVSVADLRARLEEVDSEIAERIAPRITRLASPS